MAFDLGSKAEGVTDRVLGLVVVIAILGGTIALVFTNLGVLVGAFSNPSLNNTTLNAIVPVLGLVCGITAVFGVVRLVKHATAGGES